MILRYLVALPCYNNSESIEAVILDVLRQTEFPILVIDDGSSSPVDISRFNEAERARLNLVRHEKNQGKGAALQSGFVWALKNNFTHMISFDTDGQHLAYEIPNMVKESREHPWALVIGSRKFRQDVPEVSKFGRKFSNFWVKFETGYKALDSQSGFRVYPMFYVQNLSFFTKKYDFEIEVLIRLLWRQVEVREVDIDVHYPPAGERVSHFDKWWDNVRISLLNCVLVALSLMRGHLKPAPAALALGLGVLIGTTPFFGLHALIAAGAALAFRLNFLVLLLGTQISLPFIAPFLAAGSIAIGKRFLGSELEPSGYMVGWLLGSLILGAVLGLLFGGLFYIFKKRQDRRKNITWTGKTRGGTLGNGFLKLVLRKMGLRAGYFFLFFIVPYFYIFTWRSRRSLDEYWRGVDPQLSWLARQKQILIHYFTFGQILMDRVFQGHRDDLVFEVQRSGPIKIADVAASGRGWVFIGAHMGGWDIATLFFKKDKTTARLGMVHYLAKGFTFDKVIARSSENSKVDSIKNDQGEASLITVRQYLSTQQHVGFLADRAIEGQVELIPFLGKLAPFETRPFRVAAACQAPMILTYNFKVDTYRYQFVTSCLDEGGNDLKFSADEDRRLQTYRWTEKFVRDLETKVKKYPHQWFNFYPFWSSLPKTMQSEDRRRSDHYLIEELRRPAAPRSGPESAQSPIS